MKIRWISFCRWMLGVLGISAAITSCEEGPFGLGGLGGGMLAEYGMPTMDYSVKGKVVDSKSGKGVAGIEVYHEYDIDRRDTTGVDGSFQIQGVAFPNTSLEVELHDIDPKKDGEYEDAQATVQLEQVGKGSGSWYSGSYEAKDVVLKMDPTTKN